MRRWQVVAVRGVLVVVALGVVALVILSALGAFAGTGTGPGSGSPGGRQQPRYYVSLGDSYAIGYQPSAVPGGRPHASGGYTAVVARAAGLRLANFGCAGATTTSILDTVGCPAPVTATTGAVAYPRTTQVAAAAAFLRRHRGHVGLITVSIGGNDITPCAKNADPVACVTGAVSRVRTNVATLAARLRAAAGRAVPILGLTYPDVLLGLWVYPPGQHDRGLAALSVTAFKSLFNPALQAAYAAAGGRFVDVTKETGAYTPLGATTADPPYGTVPVAVAEVCRLTWFCAQGNIHPRDAGYVRIGDAVVAAYRASGSH